MTEKKGLREIGREHPSDSQCNLGRLPNWLPEWPNWSGSRLDNRSQFDIKSSFLSRTILKKFTHACTIWSLWNLAFSQCIRCIEDFFTCLLLNGLKTHQCRISTRISTLDENCCRIIVGIVRTLCGCEAKSGHKLRSRQMGEVGLQNKREKMLNF